MLAGEREVYILGLLEQQGVVTVAQITGHSGCAPETARRDLRRLEARGLLTRTYGGGIRAGGSPARSLAHSNGSTPGTRTTLVDHVDVLVVTPSDTAATRLLADRARRVGVPIVAESHNYPGANTVVAIDDYRAGVDLGRWVAGYARLHGQGQALALDVTAPFANTNARSRGFADGLRELPPASRAIYRVDAQGRRETAHRIAADALAVHPEINVIFGINDDSALGALDAYRAAGLPEDSLLVVSFGLEGQATRDLLDQGGPYRAGVAMFPELVGRICVDAAVCAYHGCHLAERTFTPFAVVTPDNLYDFYDRDAGGTWQLNPARARHLLTTSPSVALIAQCRHQRLPARIGYVKIFSSHEWYQNMERAMQAQAQELGVSIEVVDASEDWEREIDAMKHAIGSTAARYVADGDTILLDSGRTAGYMAEALRGRQGIRVITNSLTVLAALDGERGIDLMATGGVVRHESHALVGSAAEATCRELRVDKTFIGGAGISVDFGLSNSNMAEAAIKQAMIRAARQVYVLADHTKIGVESLVKIAPLNSITTLITDSSLSALDRAALTQGGVDVIIADDRL